VANEIVIKVRLDEDGSLKQVEQSAKKAAKATDDLGKSRNRYNKGEKGVIGATANGTKAFSKMRESMTGSTGLVSAYAVLASNVFAATAAFNAFRRAAQVEQLEKGLVAVGAAAGRNLPDVAKGLREITGEALSAEQAMRATALASASGFRSDQLNDLAKVAKGASLALGRDMGDAFDRLVRGTAKVEPEILDELGIFVRLDEAVQNYADRLGVAASSLTQNERSQAFLNATIEQGLKKYEDLSQAIDPNPYDQLSASLANLQKEFLGFFNNFAGLGDAVGFAARNLGSLAAVGTTLGAAVTSTVAPGLLRMAESSAESAEGLFQVRSEMARSLVTGKGLPPKFKELADKLEDGSASAKDFGSAQSSLLGKMGATQKQINVLNQDLDENGNVTAKAQKEIVKLTNAKADYANRLSGLKDLQASQTEASISASRAAAVQNATSLNLIAAFRDLGQAHTEDAEKTREGTKEKKGFSKVLKSLGPSARTAAGGLKVLGAAFFTVLPYIGLIISGISILYGIIKEKFFPEDLVQKRLDEAIASFENFEDIQKSFNDSTAIGGQRLANSYIAYAGILDQIIGKIKEVNQSSRDEFQKTTFDLERQIYQLTQAQAEAAKQEREALSRELTADDLPQYMKDLVAEGALDESAAIASLQKQYELRLKSSGLQSQINAKIDERNAKEAELEELLKANAAAILKGAMDELRIQQAISERTGDVTPFSTAQFKSDLQELRVLYDRLIQDSAYTVDQFEIDFAIIQRTPNAIRDSFNQIDDAVSKANATIVGVGTKIKRPFQDIEEGVAGVINTITGLETAAKETQYVLGGGMMPTAAAQEAIALLEEQDENLKKLRIPKKFLEDMGKDGLLGAARKFLQFIRDTQVNMATLQKTVHTTAQAAKEMQTATAGIVGTEKDVAIANNAAKQAKINLLDEEINALTTILDTTENEAATLEEIAKLNADRLKLELSLEDTTEAGLKAQISLSKEIERQNGLKVEQVKNDLRIMKIQDSLSGGRTTPAEEFNQKVASAKAAVVAAQMELALTNARAELEEALFILRIGGAENITASEQLVLDKLRAQLDLTKQIAEEKVRGAAIGVTEAIAGGIPERTPTLAAMQGTGDSGLASAIQSGRDGLDQAQVTAAAAKTNADDTFVASLSGEATAEEVAVAEQALVAAQNAVRSAGTAMITGMIEAQAKALESLGPEGEIVAAMAMTTSNLLQNFDAFAEAGESTSDRLAAGFAMAASAIGGISSIMAAQSKQAIGEIDNQIAAEKKRDGKSKESVAKLKALEKKKEAMKRKEFEQNKKMQMAQVIANTASAIMGLWSGIKDPYVGPALAAAQMAVVAGLGAAQLAVIAGTSYQGGGSAPSASGPSGISMGERRKSVDLARSQSARGELAYFRGESGSGGPENFRNAFGGYRNRAGGGNTAFMVGEQGPELFVPETPGTIVPNDEVTQAAPTNVNFSINAVDAAGVEDLLIRQQGNIIGMIREAANSYGQDFVETVDTSVFNDTTGGVSRY